MNNKNFKTKKILFNEAKKTQILDIDDEKVKTKIQLSQKLKDKLILPARRKN